MVSYLIFHQLLTEPNKQSYRYKVEYLDIYLDIFYLHVVTMNHSEEQYQNDCFIDVTIRTCPLLRSDVTVRSFLV